MIGFPTVDKIFYFGTCATLTESQEVKAHSIAIHTRDSGFGIGG